MKSKQLIIFLIVLTLGYSTCPFHKIMESFQNKEEISLKSWFSRDTKELVYPPVTNNASETLEGWFKAIEATKYSVLPGFEGSDITSPINLMKFGAESMDITMERELDYMPEGRKKYIHPRGAVAKVKFIASDLSQKTYDGLFKGADFGLVRLSLAANPGKIGFTPGMALKFFRNHGRQSGNIIAMYSLDGQQDNYNFFQNQMSNWITEPTSLALKTVEQLVFKRASSCPIFLSLYDFGKYDQEGNVFGERPKVPRSIIFRPVQQTQFDSNKYIVGNQAKDFRDDLATLKAGSVLYQVYDVDLHQQNYLGQIVTTSQFISSSFGDESLFFKHDKGEDFGCPK